MKKVLAVLALHFLFVILTPAQSNTNGGAASPVPTEISNAAAAEESGGYSKLTNDRIDAVSKIGSVAGVLIAIFGALYQVNKNREERKRQHKNDAEAKEKDLEERNASLAQRQEELRWRKASLAREVLKEMHSDPYCTDAMLMLDWSDRLFALRNVKTYVSDATVRLEKIMTSEMLAALRTDNTTFNDKEEYIRDCFDRFFGVMERIEHFISINLLELKDVTYPFNYYRRQIDMHGGGGIFTNYLDVYGFNRAKDFLARLREYSKDLPQSNMPREDTRQTEERPATPGN